MEIRNVAIIAHVDHGKTTLVDHLLQDAGVLRRSEVGVDRVMDSGDLERERGITILSKNTAVSYGDVRINIVDTPGHADFGGEVERILQMVDGVLLLVDAFEGCMPQTRFVLKKALELGKVPVVVIIELGATAEQLDFPIVYASARNGMSGYELDQLEHSMKPIFDTILKAIPAPAMDDTAPLQILFSTIDYDDYVGKIGVGRIERGVAKRGQSIVLCGGEGNKVRPAKISRLYRFEGLHRVEVEACVEPMPFVHIDEPTVSMLFKVNDSPFAGREGRYVTSRNIRERLFKEVKTNVSMRVEETETTDTFKVSGRGELHLSILIETMRREGYEFAVTRPKVIMKEGPNGEMLEPMEELTIDVPTEFMGPVMEKLGARKGEMTDMTAIGDYSTRVKFMIPARGLMGYRSELLTDTKGNGVMSHIFAGYDTYKGPIESRNSGSLVAHETGDTSSYGLFYAQDRGRLFVGPGIPVYEGQIVGENARDEDIVVNVCKKKHVTNMRAAGSDEALRLTPPVIFTLEQCLEFIADDELVEVTPKSIRMRKKVLSKEQRMKLAARGIQV